jgi:hypothetical protein
MANNKFGYMKLAWSEVSFVEQLDLIMKTAHVCVSKVRLDNGNVVYVVPEKLYMSAMTKQ